MANKRPLEDGPSPNTKRISTETLTESSHNDSCTVGRFMYRLRSGSSSHRPTSSSVRPVHRSPPGRLLTGHVSPRCSPAGPSNGPPSSHRSVDGSSFHSQANQTPGYVKLPSTPSSSGVQNTAGHSGFSHCSLHNVASVNTPPLNQTAGACVEIIDSQPAVRERQYLDGLCEYTTKTYENQMQFRKGKRKTTDRDFEEREEASSIRKVRKTSEESHLSTSNPRTAPKHRNRRGSRHDSKQLDIRKLPFSDPIHLHDLAQKPPRLQLSILRRRSQDFSDFLVSLQDYSDTDHWTKLSLIVKILSSLLNYSEVKTIADQIEKVVVMELTSDTSTSRVLLHVLSDTFGAMPTQSSPAKRSSFSRFLEDVYTLFTQLLSKREAYFAQNLPIDALCGCSGQLAIQEIRYAEVHERNQQLLQKRDLIRTTLYETTVKSHDSTEEADYTALPSPEELAKKTLPLDLDENLRKGSYISASDYLARQYRLLREDFIHPLRCALHKLQKEAKEEDSHEVRLYKNVRFNQGTTYIPGIGTAFRVSFELPSKRQVKWDRSKCLTYGSLLCLSPDNFRSVFFATVAERNLEDLRQGVVVVKPENNFDVLSLPPNHVLQMADSPGYYAAYAPVLKHLNELKSDPSMLPFSQYLVQCSKDVQPPAYLRVEGSTTLNLTGIVCNCNENEFMERCAHKRTDIMDPQAWSELQMPVLDDSQKAALHAALTRELAIIQGPPGTGKTYIGLKIVEALLKNTHLLKQNGPIVVVCYTNHALDQFLEGLLNVKAKPTYSSLEVRRVGGRCKNERVKQYNIRTYVTKACRQLHNYDCSPQKVHALRQKIQAIRELLSGEYIPYNFKLYCSLLEQQTIDDFYQYCQFNFLNRLRSLREYGNLAEWLSDDFQKEIANWFQHGDGHEDNNVSLPHKAIEDDRRIITSEEEEESFLSKALGKDTVKRFVTKFKAVEPLTPKRVETLCRNRTYKEIDQFVRLQLFKFLLADLRVELELSLREKEAKQEQYKQERELIMVRCLREADVVGLTTTGAAKYNTTLSQIQAKTVIIEEAAEVLEAHVVTTLTRHTQHLILIGDHKQLRPKTNDHFLARDYHLNVSLFERLVDNGLPCVTLEIQHRMRPEISEIVSSHIYNGKLKNDVSVRKYDSIIGMKHNMFFVDHVEPESSDEDLKSHENVHEARFLAHLCRYLLQQGYKPEHITAITPYTGQMFTMREEFANLGIVNVQITPIDSYQGEENEIVLLSLVRSNSSNTPGFVKDRNRICVALSRAKQGFYCIGNFSLFKTTSPLWRNVLRDLANKERIGKALPLQCSRHGTITHVASAEDFDKAKDGGCGEECGSRLPLCNHVCPRNCHPSDDVHEEPCKEPCPRMCLKGVHRCKRLCFEKCGNRQCEELVEQEIPQCGHMQNVPCYQDPTDFVCQVECKKSLSCSHRCRNSCGEPCTTECHEYITRTWPCGHEAQVECYITEELFANRQKCKRPCGKVLECGHICSGTCGGCHQGRLHKRCKDKCDRPLICGHTCSEKCAQNCPPCRKRCVLKCKHGKCGHECYKPCRPCPHTCEWKCKHFQCTKNCGEICDRPRCDAPCPIPLPCGHPCVGLCGEKCPTVNGSPLCRECNKERWDKLVPFVFGAEEDADAKFIQLEDCGHIFEVGGLDHWMDMEPEGDQVEINWKTCITCKAPIHRTNRYGNVTKKIIKDMNNVKKAAHCHLGKKEKSELQIEVKQMAVALHDLFFRHRSRSLEHFQKAIDTIPDKSLQQNHVIFRAAKDASDICRRFPSETPGLTNSTFLCNQIESQFIPFLKDNRNIVTNQVQLDVLAERRRIMLLASAYKLVNIQTQLEVTDQEFLTGLLSRFETIGQKIEKLTDEAEYQSLQTQLQVIARKWNTPLTRDERKMIIKAIGAKPGSWYKCPKGHFYQIGECGGAMEEGKCPECGSRIGGSSHRLLADNAHAGDFDDSQHAAWSSGADLANYENIWH